MKRSWFMALLLGVLLCFAACDPASYYYDYSTLEEVIVIELIDYDNPDSKELFENIDDVLDFDFEKMTIIEVLHENKQTDFIHALLEMEFLQVWRHADSPQGRCIKLTYKNGDFDIIAYEVPFVCRYNESGSVKEFIGSGPGIALSNMITEYFESNIE